MPRYAIMDHKTGHIRELNGILAWILFQMLPSEPRYYRQAKKRIHKKKRTGALT